MGKNEELIGGRQYGDRNHKLTTQSQWRITGRVEQRTAKATAIVAQRNGERRTAVHAHRRVTSHRGQAVERQQFPLMDGDTAAHIDHAVIHRCEAGSELQRITACHTLARIDKLHTFHVHAHQHGRRCHIRISHRETELIVSLTIGIQRWHVDKLPIRIADQQAIGIHRRAQGVAIHGLI